MRSLSLLGLLLFGCSPLGAYSHSWGYGKELFGKDQVAEAEQRALDLKLRQGGYPVEHPRVFPHRNATD